MAQASPHAAENSRPASVLVQILKSDWSLDDLENAIQELGQSVAQLELTSAASLSAAIELRRVEHRSLQLILHESEQVLPLAKGIAAHLATHPLATQLTFAIGRTKLQIQTKDGDALLSILPTLQTLLPAQQIFQARAEAYALRGGEHSPVEAANLELLRYRLNLEPETAETIIARALGPFSDRQAKLERYREVLTAELNRESPLSETTWTELRKLYRALGLDSEDVDPINSEYIARIQAEAAQLQQQEQATLIQAETTLQEDQSQQEVAEQLNKAEHYRQEFQQAIATVLYPNDFDRGRLEQMRRLWDLDGEIVRAIEREATDERYGPVDSDAGIDYSRLRQLLWLNQWAEADQETERLILSALSRDMQPLDDEATFRMKAIDLQTIDALWARYSQNKFGFKAQHEVYVQQERRADDFLMTVEWLNTTGILSFANPQKPYRSLDFGLSAPSGHLPTWRWGADALEGAYVVRETMVDTFFLHLEKCLPDLSSAPPLSGTEVRGSES